MHDGGDNHYVALNSVNNAVRKTPCPTLAMVVGDFAPSLWVAKNSGNGSLDFIQEIQSKSRYRLIVVFDSLSEFALCGREKAISHLTN